MAKNLLCTHCGWIGHMKNSCSTRITVVRKIDKFLNLGIIARWLVQRLKLSTYLHGLEKILLSLYLLIWKSN